MAKSEPVLQLPSFRGVPGRESRDLVRNLDLMQVEAGQSVLLHPGPAQELLLVVRGQLQALSRRPWVAGPGVVVGAQALLSRTRQRHGFRAVTPSLLAYAGLHQTRTLMSCSPAFATAVAVALSQELAREQALTGL